LATCSSTVWFPRGSTSKEKKNDKNWARSHLADNGVTVMDFGDPLEVKIGEDWASTEEGIAYQISHSWWICRKFFYILLSKYIE
jgi:hypothetical protein